MSDNSDNPPTNGVVLINAQILKHGVSSSADAKIGALFANSRKAIPARTMLMEMGHKQPPTPAQTDNTTTLGFATKPCNQNMQNWWLWELGGVAAEGHYHVAGVVGENCVGVGGGAV